MNILVDVVSQFDRSAGERMRLEEVADQVHVEVPAPVTGYASEAYENAGIPFVAAHLWRGRSFEPLPADAQPTRWSVAVPVRGGEILAFVPDDSRPDPEVGLFTRVRGLAGRLRLSVPDGFGGRVEDVTFEAALHCADVACGAVEDCDQCCALCRCRRRGQGMTTMLVCGCPDHL